MQVVYDPGHVLHDPTTEVQHGVPMPIYEVPARVESIRAALLADEEFLFIAPAEHGVGPVTAVHHEGLVLFLAEAWRLWRAHGGGGGAMPPQYLPDTVLHPAIREGMGPAPEPAAAMARIGYWCWETMTPLVVGSYQAARGAVDVALTAAAAYLAERVGRVAVLDVDYHHGNGTQQIFYHRDDVLYVSLHADPSRAYPYFAGWADERGAGAGEGFTLNLPLPAGCTNADYLAALDVALERIGEHDAAALVVSLGLDTYGQDPIADFALSTDVYHEVGRRVAGLALPALVLQEGGYFVPKLGENARTWLRGLLGSPLEVKATPR